jgi:hypothetical protein
MATILAAWLQSSLVLNHAHAARFLISIIGRLKSSEAKEYDQHVKSINGVSFSYEEHSANFHPLPEV